MRATSISRCRCCAGGVVIVDNLLWGGQVAGEIRSPDQESSTNALREFNKYFVNHPKLRAEVLSVGDGLGYAVKIADDGFHRGTAGRVGKALSTFRMCPVSVLAASKWAQPLK